MTDTTNTEAVLPDYPCTVLFELFELPGIQFSKRENVPSGVDPESVQFGLVCLNGERTAAWIEQRGGWTADERARIDWVAANRPNDCGAGQAYAVNLDKVQP